MKRENIDNLIISFLRVGPVGFFFSFFLGGGDGRPRWIEVMFHHNFHKITQSRSVKYVFMTINHGLHGFLMPYMNSSIQHIKKIRG